MPAKLDAILRSIQKGNKNVKKRSDAIAIAKSQGLVKQDGQSLKLTEKGRNASVDEESKNGG